MTRIPFEKVTPHAKVPERATDGSAGYDAFACLMDYNETTKRDVPRTFQVFRRGFLFQRNQPRTEVYNEKTGIVLRPGERAIIPLGVKMTLPKGVKCEIQDKSGRAWKEALSLVNGVGLGDSDFPNEYGAIVINLGFSPLVIRHGQKVVQFVFAEYLDADFTEDVVVQTTERNGGYGSTQI